MTGSPPTLLVLDKEDEQPIGIVILEVPHGSDGIEVRLGYVLDEAVWGRGLATELIGGLVEWARAQPTMSVLAGGVAHGNEASARLLRKSGFAATDSHPEEQTHRLTLRSTTRTPERTP